ncbi:TRAF3-interacting JNK-activating modulator [Clinocottus analis]|uniref:TRAF3-interacting JNK-activating modulator n=1 Tax=Clinocottus analis TaxID=304258 RepID=UPI0035BF3795
MRWHSRLETERARGAAMDALTVSGIQLSPVKHFEQIVDIRAEKREHLRGRNNVTSCRSPTREFNTRLIKNELKEKRQLEFLRRRSVSPEPCGLNTTNYYSRRKLSPKTFLMKQYSAIKSGTLHTDVLNTPPASGRHTRIIVTPNSSVTEGPSTSNWASLWTEQVTLMKQEKGHAKKQASSSTPAMKESNQHRAKSTDKRENSMNAQKTSIRTFIQAEKIHQRFSVQTENIVQKNIQRETSVQTESGLVTVKESDLQMLTDYLQEALWREEAVKKKLVALQESTSSLMNTSNTIWTARCSEDLMRNKIKALEAQLQVCLQKFPKDGVTKLVIQMEKQKLVYEEKAMVALQKVTQEKTEALIKSETMQEALTTAKAEALRWQSLCKELKLSSEQLRENQHLNNEQLQQLHSQVELFRAREAEMREEVVSLQQEKQELQHNICLLEEDNQILREEIQHLGDGNQESQVMQELLTSKEAEPHLTARRDSQLEEQLHHTQDKLQLKERECEELQTELHAMEQECQSSQARLSQCRDELRQLSHRSRRPTQCGSWWKVSMTFLLLLGVVGVAMLWLWHPPFREQAENLYSDIEARIEEYLKDMASPQHSGCFRPI